MPISLFLTSYFLTSSFIFTPFACHTWKFDNFKISPKIILWSEAYFSISLRQCNTRKLRERERVWTCWLITVNHTQVFQCPFVILKDSLHFLFHVSVSCFRMTMSRCGPHQATVFSCEAMDADPTRSNLCLLSNSTEQVLSSTVETCSDGQKFPALTKSKVSHCAE
jgi:hypothetical protein